LERGDLDRAGRLFVSFEWADAFWLSFLRSIASAIWARKEVSVLLVAQRRGLSSADATPLGIEASSAVAQRRNSTMGSSVKDVAAARLGDKDRDVLGLRSFVDLGPSFVASPVGLLLPVFRMPVGLAPFLGRRAVGLELLACRLCLFSWSWAATPKMAGEWWLLLLSPPLAPNTIMEALIWSLLLLPAGPTAASTSFSDFKKAPKLPSFVLDLGHFLLLSAMPCVVKHSMDFISLWQPDTRMHVVLHECLLDGSAMAMHRC